MPKTNLEKTLENPDGFRTLFHTTVAYNPGTVRVFWNGQLVTEGRDDGWVELGGNRIRMKEPPRIGDVLQVWYLVG